MPASARPQESTYLSESSPPRAASLNLVDTEDYLERIHLGKQVASEPPSYDLLSKLSVAHHLAVPFDTSALHVPLEAWAERDGRQLGVKEGPGVELGKANFDRIVKRRHGGFCYSQNPLFASLLRGAYRKRRFSDLTSPAC
ncbi:MAG: arylamine N-acetyltransferase [Microbacterium hominis]|nr:arylamine N-acetyltransferase [Microbacterium hominis]